MSDVKILKCPSCAGVIVRNQNQCDWCQNELDWSDGVRVKYGGGTPHIMTVDGSLSITDELRRNMRKETIMRSMLGMKSSAINRYCDAYDLNRDFVRNELQRKMYSTSQTLIPIKKQDSMFDRIKGFLGIPI